MKDPLPYSGDYLMRLEEMEFWKPVHDWIHPKLTFGRTVRSVHLVVQGEHSSLEILLVCIQQLRFNGGGNRHPWFPGLRSGGAVFMALQIFTSSTFILHSLDTASRLSCIPRVLQLFSVRRIEPRYNVIMVDLSSLKSRDSRL